MMKRATLFLFAVIGFMGCPIGPQATQSDPMPQPQAKSGPAETMAHA